MDAGAYYLMLSFGMVLFILEIIEEITGKAKEVITPAISLIVWVIVAYWSVYIEHISNATIVTTKAVPVGFLASAMIILNAVLFLLRIIAPVKEYEI